jgi:hypothetical protein
MADRLSTSENFVLFVVRKSGGLPLTPRNSGIEHPFPKRYKPLRRLPSLVNIPIRNSVGSN